MKEEAIDYLEDRILIEAGSQDTSRPKERPAKKNWKLELLKAGLRMLQYPFPGFVTKQVWTQFRKPQRSPLNQKQKELVEAATLKQTNYKGSLIQHYQWGKSEKKILLSHGWNSKIADFRKMINFFCKTWLSGRGF